MPSKKTIKTSAKWPDNVFEEFISSGMKLHDLLDEDLQAKDYSWHQMRRLCDHYQVTTGGTKEDMALRLRLARDDAIAATALDDDEEQPQPPAPTQHADLSADADEDDAPAEDVAAASAATNSSTIAAHQQDRLTRALALDGARAALRLGLPVDAKPDRADAHGATFAGQ